MTIEQFQIQVSQLNLSDNDVLVVHAEDYFNVQKNIVALCEELRGALPGRKMVVLPSGMGLSGLDQATLKSLLNAD